MAHHCATNPRVTAEAIEYGISYQFFVLHVCVSFLRAVRVNSFLRAVRVNIIFQFGKRIEECCILVGGSFKGDVQSVDPSRTTGSCLVSIPHPPWQFLAC